MKRQTEVLIAGGSLVIATFISLGMYHFLTGPKETQSRPQNQLVKEVPIASKDIPTGEPIAGSIVFEKWPATPARKDFLHRKEIEADKQKTLIARRAIAKGEPITSIAIIDRKKGGALAALLQPGMRAASISVDPVSVSSGLIAPGDIVDVIVVPTENQATENNMLNQKTSQTVLCAVRVLALDQRTNQNETKDETKAVPRTATLEVTPRQAEILASLSKTGIISLILHAMGDNGTAECTISQEKIRDQPIKIIHGIKF